MEIAKLKALRYLWSKVQRLFRLDLEPEAPFIHIDTCLMNKSSLDPYVNMLRTTIESFAAVIGGADSISVVPFDNLYSGPSEFSRRISRNQQYIVKDEAHLTDTIDPSAGSWYIDSLVYELTDKAWKLFQEIESEGGMFKAIQTGKVQAQLKEVLSKRINDLNTRKETLLGVNKYPNINEAYNPIKPDALDINTEFKAVDLDASTLENITNLIKKGNDIRGILKSLHNRAEYETTPIKSVRLAEEFEILRANSYKYKNEMGALPKVYLVNFGVLKDFKARADFSSDFFAVAGFQSEWSNGFDNVEAAAKSFFESGLQTAVICSTNEKYREYAADFTKLVKNEKPAYKVILAGLPAELVDELKAAGIDEFIHIKANVFDMLKKLQDELEISHAKEANQGASL
jgi:methylmalonyl-CoA mutase